MIRSLVQRRIVLPAAVAVRGEFSVFRETAALRRLQFDEGRLRSIRHHRLTGILKHAREHVPHYGDAGPALDQFDILEKEDLVQHFDELQYVGRIRHSSKTTGGSTGRAVTVRKDPEAIACERAATWLAYEWYGLRPGDRAMRFWGTGGDRGRRLRSQLADLAMNRTVASAFAFSERDLAAYWLRLKTAKPTYLYGYVSMLAEMARYGLAENLEKPGRFLRAVITTSEALHPQQRALISEAFGAPVRNEYGCGEVGPIAYECSDGSMHMMESHLFVEVVDDDGLPAKSGHLLITDLMNRAMPLIRYRVGDSVVLGKRCACGRAFGTLASILGRSYDFLEDAAGRQYHGEAVMYVFEDLRAQGLNIQKFQVHQKIPGHVNVLFVAPSRQDAVREGIQSGLAQLGGMVVEAQTVEAIDVTRSGKARLIVRE